MNQDLENVLPTWVPGVDLRQTAMDCVQVVGDIARPIALQGMGANGLEWLRQLDGSRSWIAQEFEAQARGLLADQARTILQELAAAALLIDARLDGAGHLFSSPVVIGSRPLSELLVDLVPGATFGPVIPKARDGGGWRIEAERVTDEVGDRPTIVALDRQMIDRAEADVIARLVDRRATHVVVGAGTNTARVGPITIDGQGPCSRCDEELKLELDPTWRHLSAEFALDAPPSGASGLTTLAAAEAARQIAHVMPGTQVAALNAILTTGFTGDQWHRRALAHHLKCGCWWSVVSQDHDDPAPTQVLG